MVKPGGLAFAIRFPRVTLRGGSLFLGLSYITWIVLLAPPAAFLLGIIYYYAKAGKEEGE